MRTDSTLQRNMLWLPDSVVSKILQFSTAAAAVSCGHPVSEFTQSTVESKRSSIGTS